jgi:hypothetical protein
LTLFIAERTLSLLMGRKLIKFGTPREVTNPGQDSRSVLFPFYVLPRELVGAPEMRQSITKHRLIVTITNSRLPAWKLNDADLFKVLFELGQREVVNHVRTGRLQREVRMTISTATHPATCPFDPRLIREPKGAAYEVDEERTIGFK